MADNGAAAAATTATSTVATATPANGGAPSTAAPAMSGAPGQPKFYDVKVDGKVMRMTEAELMQNASLGKAAFKRMEEANALNTRAQNFFKELQADPFKAIDKLPIAPAAKRAMLEKYYSETYIKSDQMSPEQKELAEHKKWRADREAQDKKQSEQTAAQQRQVATQKYVDQFTNHFISVCDKGGLPKDAYTIGRMAYHYDNAVRLKHSISDEQLVEAVRNDDQNRFSAYSKDATAEQLISLLGPDAVKKIQRYALEQHRNKLKEGGAPRAVPTAEARSTSKRKIGDVDAGQDGWKKATKYFTRHDK